MSDEMEKIKELQKQVDHLESTISALMSFISIKEDNLFIRAKGDIKLQALNFKVSALNIKLDGTTSAITSSGITEIKGSLVQIN